MESLKKLSRAEMKNVLGGSRSSIPVCDPTCSVEGAQCGDHGCFCSFIKLDPEQLGDYVCG